MMSRESHHPGHRQRRADGADLCPRRGRPEPHFWAHGDREFCPRRVSDARDVRVILVLGTGGLDPLLSLPLVAALLGAGRRCSCTSASSGGCSRHRCWRRFAARSASPLRCARRRSSSGRPDFRTITNPWIAGRVQIGPIFIGQPQLIAGAICLLAFVALWLFVTRTETGLGLQATSQDRQAAAVMGIPTERMSALGWAIGLGCVGVAGTMLSTFFYIFPDVGVNFAPAGLRRRRARRVRQHPRQPRRRRADRAGRVARRPAASIHPTRR